jgi:hypothetical protein
VVIHGDEFLTWHWHQSENAVSTSLLLPLSSMAVLGTPALVSSQGKEVAEEKRNTNAQHLGWMQDEKDGRTLSISILAATSRADLLISLFSFALRLQYIIWLQSVLLKL